MDSIERSCHAVLGLAEGASREEVETAFKHLKMESGANWNRLKEITWAYETLVQSSAAGNDEAGTIPAAATDREGGPAFAASFALWWTGQNFIDMAPYINDARAQQLMLIGGATGRDVPGYHDWNNILGRLGLLNLDHALANTSHLLGSILMTAAFAWGGIILYMQWKNLDR